MNVRYPEFGVIEIEGERFEHDVVVEAGQVRRRNKKASKEHRDRYGHTPLSADEELPWSSHRLIVGTGAHGRLPIMPEVYQQARDRDVEVVALPTDEAAKLLGSVEASEAFAVLHVTC